MHELSLAMSVVDEVGQILAREKASQVLCISLSIGELSGVEREPFEFCFPFAAQGTPLEHAQLKIDTVKTAVLCGDCGKKSTPDFPMLVCAQCDSSNIKIVAGQDFLITSLEVE
jgi:hydrogenase nickel incorporation protein HypA/HybF